MNKYHRIGFTEFINYLDKYKYVYRLNSNMLKIKKFNNDKPIFSMNIDKKPLYIMNFKYGYESSSHPGQMAFIDKMPILFGNNHPIYSNKKEWYQCTKNLYYEDPVDKLLNVCNYELKIRKKDRRVSGIISSLHSINNKDEKITELNKYVSFWSDIREYVNMSFKENTKIYVDYLENFINDNRKLLELYVDKRTFNDIIMIHHLSLLTHSIDNLYNCDKIKHVIEHHLINIMDIILKLFGIVHIYKYKLIKDPKYIDFLVRKVEGVNSKNTKYQSDYIAYVNIMIKFLEKNIKNNIHNEYYQSVNNIIKTNMLKIGNINLSGFHFETSLTNTGDKYSLKLK